MRGTAPITVAVLSVASASGWSIKSTSAQPDINASCYSIGALCSGAHCCAGLACSPVLNYETAALEARCVVVDASNFDATACYAHQDKCFYNQQCCSGVCRDSEVDRRYTCLGNGSRRITEQPTVWSSSTTTTTDISDAGVTDPWAPTESPHWGTLDEHVPLGIFLVIVLLVIIVAIVVVPRVVHHRQLQALGVDKLPPTPQPITTEVTADADVWTANPFGGKFLVGWRDSLMDAAAGEPDEYSPIEPEKPALPDRDYAEMGYIEITDVPLDSPLSTPTADLA
mmetsp:Transcript_21548/g.64137  ORF Transcript_21548/g.64137 Transcript_21548/m.64137 type:complete len:283 (-) Transcript_21548:1471-2319(-)